MGGNPVDDLNQTAARLSRLCAADLDSACLESALISAVRLQRTIEWVITTLVASLEQRLGRSASLDVLQLHAGVDGRAARRLLRLARLIDRFPALADTVREGRADIGVMELLSSLCRPLAADELAEVSRLDGQLAELACSLPYAGFGHEAGALLERTIGAHRERLHRRHRARMRASRWIDLDGVHHLSATFDAETGARVFTAIGAAVHQASKEQRGLSAQERLDPAQLEATVVADLLCGGRRRTGPADLAVIVDYDVLKEGLDRAGARCETTTGQPLPASSVRRLACEANLIPVVLNGRSEVLDIGRARRLATSRQRLALAVRFRHCVIDGCDVPFHRCEIHHLHPFEVGGSTDLANLVPLCSRHHHRLHDDPNAVLARGPDGSTRLHRQPVHGPPTTRVA